MLTIETHYHASEYWFEPIEVLLFHMSRNGIDKAVLAQQRYEFDNSYFVECIRRFPGRFSAIGIVDTTKENAGEELEFWGKQGIEGARFWADERSPGKDPYAVWKKAESLKMVVSCPGTTQEYGSEEFHKVVEAVPNMPIVLEHLGLLGELKHGADKKIPQPPYTDFRKALALAKYPNVYMKITAFGEYMARPVPFRHPALDISKAPPFIDMAVEAFGANRLMIGTDPTSSSREGFANAWKYIKEYIKKFSLAQQEAMLGKTAAAVFPFRS